MVNQSFVSRLAFCASFFALSVIALGAFTRLIDAGLGCPDWPGCYGHFAVPSHEAAGIIYPTTPLVAYKAWAEMIHRYFVGGLSLFILGIAASILSKKSLRFRSNFVLVFFLFALLIYQILLGKWTVTLKLLPIVVTQHLLGGFLILTAVWLIYLNNKSTVHVKARPSVPYHTLLLVLAVVAIIILFLQIALGAWTSTNYASLSCPDFPFCVNTQTLTLHLKQAFNLHASAGVNYEGGVLPEAVRQTIQMSHRLGALIFSVYIFVFTLFALRALTSFPHLIKSLYLILGLLCVQLCIGISNVIFKLPLFTAVSHTLVAVLLLLSLVTFIFNIALLKRKE